MLHNLNKIKLFLMQNNFNKINKIFNFSLDEDSINTINESTKIDKNKIYDKEKCIEEAVKNIFPFESEKKENVIVLEPKEEEIIKKAVFKTLNLKKKRGRKPKNISNKKKNHTAKSQDNLIRKIHTHFIKFIIFLLNDIAATFLGEKKPLFQKLDYSEIKVVNFKTVKKLKGLKIRKLFSKFNISPKYNQTTLKDGKNINEQNLDELSKYPGFKEFINQNFLKVFNIYYNNGKRLKSISIGGKVIPLSENTKDFSYLFKNNEQLENELLEIVELVYLNQNILNISFDKEEQK